MSFEISRFNKLARLPLPNNQRWYLSTIARPTSDLPARSGGNCPTNASRWDKSKAACTGSVTVRRTRLGTFTLPPRPSGTSKDCERTERGVAAEHIGEYKDGAESVCCSSPVEDNPVSAKDSEACVEETLCGTVPLGEGLGGDEASLSIGGRRLAFGAMPTETSLAATGVKASVGAGEVVRCMWAASGVIDNGDVGCVKAALCNRWLWPTMRRCASSRCLIKAGVTSWHTAVMSGRSSGVTVKHR
mmetsp:Transcript_69975/g.200531  ORF Transcript_69975/g.200531 Transcript_69975/m.200531 type:complete len:245 (+) Transcript_69975:395-1129(+)